MHRHGGVSKYGCHWAGRWVQGGMRDEAGKGREAGKGLEGGLSGM